MPGPYRTFREIPRLITWGDYSVAVPWRSIERHLAELDRECGLQLNPDYQRDHVWTREQQIAFIEFVLQGGTSGRDILWNCPSWQHASEAHEPIELVDGKQRLQAVREFMAGRLPAFGSLIGEFADEPDIMSCRFTFHVNSLPTRRQVMQWYLQLNDGGTAHTRAELDKVRDLMAAEAEDELALPRP